jgi:putative redox protein
MSPVTLVTVAENGSGRYSERVNAGRHVLLADEPAARGGQDTGPSPYEFLLAALGACTAITLRMYVERLNWTLRRATVELQHKKMLAPDGASTIDCFQRIISLEGDLTDEQRLKLLEIADKCPVSETLRHAAMVDSKLADAPSPTLA